MTAEPEIRYTTTADGVAIAYAVAGEGPPLLCARGLLTAGLDDEIAGSTQLWPALKESHSVVLWDSRGMGLSGNAPEAGFDDWLADMEAVAEAASADRFDLVGVRTACHLAMAYAARQPDRVNRLVLHNPSPPGSSVRRLQPAWLFALATENWHDFVDMLALREHGWDRADVAQRFADRIRAHFTSAQFLHLMDVTESIDATRDGGDIKTPTLVIDDRVAPMYPAGRRVLVQQFARQLAAAIPGAQLAIIKPGDALAAQVVERFLSAGREAPTPFRSDALPSRGRQASASRTIIYTDIEGNTGMLQRLGDDAWRAVLRDHERITRELLRAHGGTEVKTMGDGFMASFDSATSAVECAIDLQRSFAARNDTAAEPMLVRVGLNAGEPIEEDDDLFGTAVTTASRIMGQGSGGEILVSDLVRGLVAGKGFVFADRGEFVPKGFDEGVRLWEVRWQE
ncbi:MAG: adenylate/guanylate cyclase domain-containing protein [Chloroflexota bacterium]|nr:adenylate/guanylate cyclase domain-containing protein [Chloroflexota bacterium]